MTAKKPSPLVGYNTGILHRGVPFHVQTEDSGVDHPHVITHLFAEGGHIVATSKTSYAEHVGTPAYPDVVRDLIRGQHKQMLLRLRDGTFDELIAKLPVVAAPTAPPPAAPLPDEPCREPEPARGPGASAPRVRARPSFPPPRDTSADSLDEIIIADLIQLLDE